MKRKKIGLTGKVFIGFVLGILLGIVFGEKITVISFVGTIFLNLVQMNVVPLIFFSIVSGIASMSDVARLRKIGIKTLMYYILTTMCAAIVGLAVVNLVQPGTGLDMTELATGNSYESKAMPGLGATLIDMFPKNIFASMTSGNLMQIIVFSAFLGVTLVALGDKAKGARSLFRQGSDIMCKMTDIVMRLSPYGVCALMACVTGQYGLMIFGPLAEFIACVVGAQLFVLFVVYVLMLRFLAHVPAPAFFKRMVPVWLMTLSTTSSSATLPTTTKVAEERFGVNSTLAGFTLPLGATINMNGAVILFAIAALFVAQIYGIDLSLGQQINLVLLTTMISVGSPGIPGGAIVMTTILLTNMGLPLDMVGVLAGINRIIDMGDTSINVTGDVVSTLCIARSEKLMDDEILLAGSQERIHRESELADAENRTPWKKAALSLLMQKH
ncbi:MAG: Dicarboxylate/amino acid:cation symporter [Mitsuokella multacida]